jgi:hypothetical protein
MSKIAEFFLNPIHTTQKRYEVLRGIYVQQMTAKDVAAKFGYSVHTVNVMKRAFVKAMKENKMNASDFFGIGDYVISVIEKSPIGNNLMISMHHDISKVYIGKIKEVLSIKECGK